MCGIAGIIGDVFNGDGSVIKRMLDNLAHRGPDAEGIYTNRKMAFGHRRLSIIDLSIKANQPFLDTSKRFVIVFNGEIYNYKELKDLINYPWQTSSDTEVILAAFIKWGYACLNYLNGMFAFAIYDAVKEELFIARDRLGVKPLYYYLNENIFLFASEIRSLLSSGYIKSEIDHQALRGYLAGIAVPTPNCMVKGIKQLNPGEYGFLKNGIFGRKFYWSVLDSYKPTLGAKALTYKETLIKTRFLMEEAVKSRMVADVKVGAFLSGGIDSSTIVAIMSKHNPNPIETFSITFNEKEFDESKYAQIIAEKYKTKHSELLLDPSILINNLDDYITDMDSPTVDGINTYIVSKLVAETGIKVALSGIGGDELFAGYPGFIRWKIFSNFKYLVDNGFAKTGISAISQLVKSRAMFKVANLCKSGEFDFSSFYSTLRANFLDSEINNLLGNNNIRKESDSWINLNDSRICTYHCFSQFSIAELTRYTLDALLKDTDQMSMRWALEVREPFFDYKLVEFLLTVPDIYKYSRKTSKVLLVEAMGEMLPKEIVYRPKKGFSFPWDKWIRNELKEFCDSSIQRLNRRGIFDQLALSNIWRSYLNGNAKINWVQIWSLIILENWLDKNKISVQ